MTEKHHRATKSRPQVVSRRNFITLAAATGLLAGCRPVQKTAITPNPAPTPAPQPVENAPGRVVQASHSGVWSGEELVPEPIDQMLDASITRLTGIDDAGRAWAALFSPDERVAIKVNTISGSDYWTHVPLVIAVTERLQGVGIPAEQIVIFDRNTYELEAAGFPINEDGPGVRCYGTFNRPQACHSQFKAAVAELNGLSPIKDRTRLIIGDTLTIVQGGWRRAWPGDSILMRFDPVAHDAVGLLMLVEAMSVADAFYAGFGQRAISWLQSCADQGLGTNEPDQIKWTILSL